MTRAVFDLQNSDEKIIDIALQYGYESPTAFNRAFQSVHGMASSAARAEGVTLKAYPPISFKITIKGEAEMNYRIEKKGAFKIAGVREHYSMNIEECFSKVEWLPNSGYEYANAPDIEVYFEGNQQAEDYRCEVWLPVEKK